MKPNDLSTEFTPYTLLATCECLVLIPSLPQEIQQQTTV
jgi:hypothetical protein